MLINIINTKHPGPVIEAPSASEDTIILLTGGRNDEGYLSTSELFPSLLPACNPLSLEKSSIFTTAEEKPRVAACGGSGSACLVLDLQAGIWNASRLGSLPQPRSYHTAVTLKSIGNYLIGGYGTTYGNHIVQYKNNIV